MSDVADPGFHEGDAVWVVNQDGSARAAEYVGQAETSAWFGGPPRCYVVYIDSRQGEAVETERLLPRDA